jgi:hypothetical protein
MYYKCKCCKENIINECSESYICGCVCAVCRDKIIPKYIPLKQHKKYLNSKYKIL